MTLPRFEVGTIGMWIWLDQKNLYTTCGIPNLDPKCAAIFHYVYGLHKSHSFEMLQDGLERCMVENL